MRPHSCVRWSLLPLACVAFLDAQPTLRQAAAQRALLIGAAADADEYGRPSLLANATYAATLAGQYSMLEPENAMKWDVTQPGQTTFNFEPGDQLVTFAQAHQMQVRGHNLCWHSQLPGWLSTYAKTATPAQMATQLQNHINTVVGHYKGQVFAWDVVNEAFNDPSGTQIPSLRDSVWNNQPGIGATGTGYIEQAFRWAHDADPNALLFYNDYSIEAPGAKFTAVLNMVTDFVARGVPINGVGFEMHLTSGGFPSASGLAQNMQQLAALGLQVHITEMDVRLPVDSSGNASVSALQGQADVYQRILTVCLQNPNCTAFQTWGFTDAHSWIPGSFTGFGAALPFDANYQPKPAFNSLIDTLQTVAPALSAANIVNAASYKGGAVAPGELVTIFGANYGPGTLVGAQLDSNGLVSSLLGGTQVLFDGVASPFIYALAGQSSVIVPYEIAGKTQTVVQYIYNGVKSNTVTIPVSPSAAGIFAANAAGSGPGLILNPDYTLNSAQNPIAAGSFVTVLATGGGSIVGGAMDGALAPGVANQTLTVTATIGGVNAPVLYAGAAPGLVNGVMQVNLTVPSGLSAGQQAVVISVGGVPSQSGITVAVK